MANRRAAFLSKLREDAQKLPGFLQEIRNLRHSSLQPLPTSSLPSSSEDKRTSASNPLSLSQSSSLASHSQVPSLTLSPPPSSSSVPQPSSEFDLVHLISEMQNLGDLKKEVDLDQDISRKTQVKFIFTFYTRNSLLSFFS